MGTLHIYIAGHCPVSTYSIELAREVKLAFPQLSVNVIDLEQPGTRDLPLPEDLAFTPGYFLDGRPIYWGNPRREELFRTLERAMNEGELRGLQ